MRTFGLLLLVGGIAGALYCSDQIAHLEPVPPGLSISASLQYSAGRFEVAEYVGAAAAFMGAILILMPRRSD